MTMGSYHIDYRSPSAPFKGGSSFGPFWAYTMMYYFWWFFHYSRPNSLTMMVWMNFYDKKNIAGPLSVVIGSFRTLKDSEKWVYLVKIGIKSAEKMVLAEWPRWILGFPIMNGDGEFFLSNYCLISSFWRAKFLEVYLQSLWISYHSKRFPGNFLL